MEELFSILVFVAYFVFTYVMSQRKKRREAERKEGRAETEPQPTYHPEPERTQEEQKRGRSFEDVFREIFDEPQEEPEQQQQLPQPVFREEEEVSSQEMRPSSVPEPKGHSLDPLANKSRADVDLIKAEEALAFDPDRRQKKRSRRRIDLRKAIIYQAILDRPYK